MAKVSEYIKESYVELTEKVTWPTWRELQSSAVLVLVATIIIAATNTKIALFCNSLQVGQVTFWVNSI